MSATYPCSPCCSPAPLSVNIPGVQGADGKDGTNGIDATTFTTANMIVPAVGLTVTVQVQDSTWMIVGQIMILTGPANFVVTALPTTTSVTLEFLGYPGDVAPGAAILSGSVVSPTGMRGGGTLYYFQTAISVTATAFMDVIDVTATGQTITLPTAVGIPGKVYTVKLSAAAVSTGTVDTTGGETIDGAANYSLSATMKFVTVVSDGANWLIIGKN